MVQEGDYLASGRCQRRKAGSMVDTEKRMTKDAVRSRRRPTPAPAEIPQASTDSGTARAVAFVKLFLTSISWGSAFVVSKVVLAHLPALTLVAWRQFLAGLILMVLHKAREGDSDEGRKAESPLKHLLSLLALGATGIFLYGICFIYGLRYGEASTGSLIVATNPILIVLASVPFLGERLTTTKIGGAVCSFTGVILVVAAGAQSGYAERPWLAAGLFGAASISWCIYSILGKKVMRQLTPLATAGYATLIGGSMLLSISLFEKPWLHLAGVPAGAWLALLYLALVPSVLGFLWWYEGINSVGAGVSSVFINLVPVSAVLLGAAFIPGESISAFDVLGGALVVAGVTLTSRDRD